MLRGLKKRTEGAHEFLLVIYNRNGKFCGPCRGGGIQPPKPPLDPPLRIQLFIARYFFSVWVGEGLHSILKTAIFQVKLHLNSIQNNSKY